MEGVALELRGFAPLMKSRAGWMSPYWPFRRVIWCFCGLRIPWPPASVFSSTRAQSFREWYASQRVKNEIQSWSRNMDYVLGCCGSVLIIAILGILGRFFATNARLKKWGSGLSGIGLENANILRGMFLVVGDDHCSDLEAGLIFARAGWFQREFLNGEMSRRLDGAGFVSHRFEVERDLDPNIIARFLWRSAEQFVAPTRREARTELIWQVVLLANASGPDAREGRLARGADLLRRSRITPEELDEAEANGLAKALTMGYGSLPMGEPAALRSAVNELRRRIKAIT